MKVGEYYWYDPFDANDLKGFQIQNGRYQELQPDVQGNLVSPTLGLKLVKWDGPYYDVTTTWLRWAYPDGTLIPSREELWMAAEANADAAQANATQAQSDAVQAQELANQAQNQVQQIVNNLKASGMDAAQISIVTGLPIGNITHSPV